MNFFKRISFGLLGIVMVVLTLATILEKIYGNDFAGSHIYRSVPFVLLWGITALSGLIFLIRRKKKMHFFTLMIHLSFVVILLGAFITWQYGKQGTLHLKKGEIKTGFTDKNDSLQEFPFLVSLDHFQVIYYAGTHTPVDFVSEITIDRKNPDEHICGKVSMNRIFSCMGYRFYQSGYDQDGAGTRLAVSYDPYGIAVTYTGYGILLLSMIFFFFGRYSNFRRLIKSPLLRRGTWLCLILISCSSGLWAAPDKPKVLPEEVAAKFGDIRVLYHGRICPLQTLAKDFTVKLCGSTSYRGYTSEQVFTGWMFYYTSWKKQPMIKIKGGTVRHLLGIKGKYASLEDFRNRENKYKLADENDKLQSGKTIPERRNLEEADEKYKIILMLYSGKMMKIFPYQAKKGAGITWYSPNDPLPRKIENDTWIFIRKFLDYIHEMVIKKDDQNILHLLEKIQTYQQKEAGAVLPSRNKFYAEKVYNHLNYSFPLSVVCILTGLLVFIIFCIKIIDEQPAGHIAVWLLNLFLFIVFSYLTVVLGLRWYISNHLPLSNGFETMQFMAWCCLILTFLLQKKFKLVLPFGSLLCGLALMVSMMGESNPPVTLLMPVLTSPLLCIHVVTIMIAYSLFAFMMLNGITAVVLSCSKKNCLFPVVRLQIISRIILYPALFFLMAGIFIGAVWANISWGRYWGWDPKEVWALITMLIYALALHPASLPWFRRPMFFHLFTILAFLSVLITYFGVNFVLGGMHSYAG